MDVRRLVVLDAIAATGSLTAAARDLSMTQPAVSRQLAALEREVGAVLVARGSRHAPLTSAGRLLLDETAAARRGLDTAVRRVREAASGDDAGSVRLGAVPSALAAVVPSALTVLRERRPRVEITVEEGWSAALRDRVTTGELDVSITARRAREARGDDVLLREPLLVLVAADHRLVAPRRASVTDLADETWLVAAEPDGRGTVLEVCAAAGFRPRIVGATTWDATGPLVAAGLGIALAPASAARRIAAVDGVATVALRERPQRDLVLRRSTASAGLAAVSALVMALQEAAS